VLTWSTHFYLAALLDVYVGPKPAVVDHVRQQLLQDEERDKILRAIEDRRMGRSHVTGEYTGWLSHSGLDFKKGEPDLTAAIDSNRLLRALFDLMLGRRAKSRQLGHYTEVHDARCLVRSFLVEHGNLMSSMQKIGKVWWDGINPIITPGKPWISTALRENGSFLSVFESWLSSGEHLQHWLDSFEAETVLVNNPEGTNRVFSATVAAEVLKWAKVGRLNGDQLGSVTNALISSSRAVFSTRGGEQRSEISQTGLSKNARASACSPQECHGFPSCSSMTSRTKRCPAAWDSQLRARCPGVPQRRISVLGSG